MTRAFLWSSYNESDNPRDVYFNDKHGYQSEDRDPSTPEEHYNEALSTMNLSLQRHSYLMYDFQKLTSLYYWLHLPPAYKRYVRVGRRMQYPVIRYGCGRCGARSWQLCRSMATNEVQRGIPLSAPHRVRGDR